MLRKRISCAPYICLLKMRFTVLHCMLRIGLLVCLKNSSIKMRFMLLWRSLLILPISPITPIAPKKLESLMTCYH